jgi:hypothetical protein
MSKLMLNSLQGKFGQIGHSQRVLDDAPMESLGVRRWLDLESDQRCTDLTFGGRVIRSISGGESASSFPAIPAHVTAYARLHMWHLIVKAGLDHVYYIDTDSIITDEAGYAYLQDDLDPFELGKLKVESVSDDVTIHARKDYEFAGQHIQKGIRKNAEKTGENQYTQWNFTTLKWGLKHSAVDDARLRLVTKTVRYMMVQGKVGKDHRITPPHLNMSRDDVLALYNQDRTSSSWSWEFDPQWFESVTGLRAESSGLSPLG